MKSRLDVSGRPSGGSHCAVTGKLTWSSRHEAKRMARRATPSKKLSAYDCPECWGWHIGNLPDVVRRGELDRTELRIRAAEKRRRA